MAAFPRLILQDIKDTTKFPPTFQKWLLQLQNYLDGLATVPVGVVYGGTGLSTVNQGDMLYASAADIITRLSKDSNATRYLANTGTNNGPKWDQVNLTNGVTGILQAAQFPALTGAVTTVSGSLAVTLKVFPLVDGNSSSPSLLFDSTGDILMGYV